MVDDIVLALLHIQPAQGDEQIVKVTHTPFQIGRAQPSDLQLPGQRVSRQHIRLLFEDDRVSLVDLNSSNGTLLAGTRLPPNQPQPIEFGQRFMIGDYTLWLEAVAVPHDETVAIIRAPEPEILPELEASLPVAMPEPEAALPVAMSEPAELVAPPPIESAPAPPAPLVGSAPAPLAPPPLPPAATAAEDLLPSDEGG